MVLHFLCKLARTFNHIAVYLTARFAGCKLPHNHEKIHGGYGPFVLSEADARDIRRINGCRDQVKSAELAVPAMATEMNTVGLSPEEKG